MIHQSYIKKNKYGAVKQTVDGYSYMSKLEANYAVELNWRIKAEDIKSYRRQVKIPIIVCGKLICNYYIDFVVLLNDGTEEWTEVKGMDTEVWKMKWKLVQAIWPERKWLLVR